MPPPPNQGTPSNMKGMPSVFELNPVQSIGSCVKATAISCKRLVTEVTKCPSNVPHMCQQAEKSAFLVLVATVELEKKLSAQNDPRLQTIAKTAEDLYKIVCNLTAMASQLVGTDHEEAHTNFQRVQLTFSERVNTLLQLVSTIHLDSITRVSSKDALKGPVQSEFEAKGLDMQEIKDQKGFAFMFSLAKRIAEMVSKIPQDMETLKPDEILECAKDRENCVSLLVNLARKFARSRVDSAGQQPVLDSASRTKAVSTAFFSIQKAIVARKKSSKGEQQKMQKIASSFSKELTLLIKSLVQAKGSEGTKNKEIDIWDEETEVGKNIVFDEKDKTQLKCATLNQMIIHLTDPEARAKDRIEFIKAFIATFQSFASSDDLFRKLVQRYHVPRRKFRDTDAAEWRDNVVKPLQLRVHVIFVRWIDERFTDFNYGMVKKLTDFVDNSLRSDGLNTQAEQILSKIRKNIKALQEKDEPARNLAPNTNVNEVLLATNEVIMAQHFTLQEFRIYQRIQPVELLNLAWSNAKLRHRAPNVMKMIDRANIVAAWVTTVLLAEVSLRARAKTFAKLIKIAQACFDLRNYNTLLAMIAGLNNAAVNRLKYTKDETPNKIKVLLEDLKAKMSPDAAYKSIREILHSGDPPALPYLGVYLTDLTFIEEGNLDYVGDKSNGLINFKKRMYVYGVLTEIQDYQRLPFNFPEDPKIMMCLEHLQYLEADANYKISLEREGRNVQKSDLVP